MQNQTDLDALIDSRLLTLVSNMSAGRHKFAFVRGSLKTNHHDAFLLERTKGKMFTTIRFIYQQREAKSQPVYTKG